MRKKYFISICVAIYLSFNDAETYQWVIRDVAFYFLLPFEHHIVVVVSAVAVDVENAVDVNGDVPVVSMF